MKPLNIVSLLLSVAPASIQASALPAHRSIPVAHYPEPLSRRGACMSSAVASDSGCTPESERQGLWIDRSTCSEQQTETLEDSLRNVQRLARAGEYALRPDYNQPGKDSLVKFFFDDLSRRRLADVEQFVATVGYYATGRTPEESEPIRISCRDEARRCETQPANPPRADKARDTVAYTIESSQTISVCPFFFYHPMNLNPPCKGGLSQTGLRGMGATKTAQLLVHFAAHLIRPERMRDSAVGTAACGRLAQSKATSLLDPSTPDPIDNADTYARFLSWAFDLGFESPGAGGANLCLQYFPPPPESRAGEPITWQPWFDNWQDKKDREKSVRGGTVFGAHSSSASSSGDTPDSPPVGISPPTEKSMFEGADSDWIPWVPY